jgi:hypothetical protein
MRYLTGRCGIELAGTLGLAATPAAALDQQCGNLAADLARICPV